jgi:heme-degrading monooxygenase HmoA
MVITILEAHVAEQNWSALKNDFRSRTAELPPQMIRTYLLQDTADQTLWRIVSVWKSREALNEMRNSGETPTGVLMFRNVGAEPQLSIFNVPVFAPQ